MADLDRLIQSMQFTAIYDKNPLNTSSEPREVITYRFETGQPSDLWQSFSGWTLMSNSEKDKFREAMDHIETFLNVEFQEVRFDSDPDFNLGKVSLSGNTIGLGGFSLSNIGSTIVEYDSFAVFDNLLDLSDEINLILHELGHGLGLKHPFEGIQVPAGTESNKYSVMSYTANPDNGLDSDAMMLYDVLALQDIWGAADYNTGNTRYTGKRTDTVDAIWDTGGTDTLDANGRSSAVKIDLREGAFSKFGSYDDIVITYGTVIENGFGAKGKDDITGNDGNNRLAGREGNDRLKGLDGNDDLIGQWGSDKLFGGDGKDFLNGGNGRDTLAGQGGRDKMKGGGGEDTFIYRQDDRRDLILDFADDVDTLNLRDFDFANKAEALSYATEKNGNLIFKFDDLDRLKILDMTKADLPDDLLV
ncbi:MAG: M10 family metallopeptidase [Pseudomonadota bacterium]